MGIVYKITSPSGKIYIGSTIGSTKRRWTSYKQLKCQAQPKLYKSLVKYGVDNHKFEVIWEGPSEERLKRERLYGDLYEVLDKNKGLNLKLPRYEDVPAKYSEETREKMSKSRKLVKSVLTKKCREASVAIRSLPVNSYNLEGNFIQNHPSIKQASKDTGVSPAQIRFCCIDEAWSAKGYQFRFNKGDEGINISPYIKNPSIKRKSISMYSENWEYIRDFDSVKDAAKHFNVNTIVIYKSHKKGGKLTTLGYRFKLKDN